MNVRLVLYNICLHRERWTFEPTTEQVDHAAWVSSISAIKWKRIYLAGNVKDS